MKNEKLSKEFIAHFNPNHDPASGRFTTGSGKGGFRLLSRKAKKTTKKLPPLSKEEVERIINSADAKLVSEHKHQLTTQDINNALSRIDAMERLDVKVKDSKKSANRIGKIVKRALNMGDSTAKAINGTTNMIKAFDNLSKALDDRKKDDPTKKKIFESNDPEKILKYLDENPSKVSTNELKEAHSRITTLNALKKQARDSATTVEQVVAGAEAVSNLFSGNRIRSPQPTSWTTIDPSHIKRLGRR